jgi:hypothetical protein
VPRQEKETRVGVDVERIRPQAVKLFVHGLGSGTVAAQGHRSGKPAHAGAKGNLCGRATYGRPGVPSAGDSTGHDVIDGTVRPRSGYFGPTHWTTECTAEDHAGRNTTLREFRAPTSE